MKAIQHFEIGATVYAKLHTKKPHIAGVVLDSSDVSTAEHGYELYIVELQKTVKDWNGEWKTHKWTHPSPIQGYKLKRRHVDEREENHRV